MKLDLRKAQKSLMKYIKTRVRDYPVYVNAGPGEDDDPITQITFGYQFDQAGWAALVFDTRTACAVDGTWQNYIEENALELPQWCELYAELCENENTVDVIKPDGSRETLGPDCDLAEMFGLFLRDLLVSCRDDGVFDKLPRATDCKLTIEEHEVQYGWTDSSGDDGAEELSDDPFAVSDNLKTQTAKSPKPKQITFWIQRLKQIAAETERDPEDYEFDVDSNVHELAEIGADAVVPMLKLAAELAGKPQYAGDGDHARELYRSLVLEQMIHKVDDLESATPEIEKLLRQVVTKSVKVNQGRKVCGSAGFFAAQALFNLFETYPCPELGDDNSLVDPKPFSGQTKK